MSSTFLPLSGSPRKKPEPMTVSTSDLTTGLARVQIKLLVDFKLLRTYSNGLGVGKLLRVDLSDNQGRISAVAFADVATRMDSILSVGKTYMFKLPTIQKVFKKTGEDTQGLELLLTHGTSIVQELHAPLERTLKFFQDLENCAGTVAIQVTIVSIRDEPFYFACHHCKKKNAEEATVCVACGKSPLSWRLLLNMTVRDTAGQHRHVAVFEEQARVLIGELPQGADVFEAVEQRFPELIGAVAVFVCRNKSSSADQHSSLQVLDVELHKVQPSFEGITTPTPSVGMRSMSPVASSSSTSSQSLDGFEIASSFTAKRVKLEDNIVKLEQEFFNISNKPTDVEVLELPSPRKVGASRTSVKK